MRWDREMKGIKVHNVKDTLKKKSKKKCELSSNIFCSISLFGMLHKFVSPEVNFPRRNEFHYFRCFS